MHEANSRPDRGFAVMMPLRAGRTDRGRRNEAFRPIPERAFDRLEAILRSGGALGRRERRGARVHQQCGRAPPRRRYPRPGAPGADLRDRGVRRLAEGVDDDGREFGREHGQPAARRTARAAEVSGALGHRGLESQPDLRRRQRRDAGDLRRRPRAHDHRSGGAACRDDPALCCAALDVGLRAGVVVHRRRHGASPRPRQTDPGKFRRGELWSKRR